MNKNFLTTKDNKIIKFSDLISMVPYSVYNSDLQDKVCFYLSKRVFKDVNTEDFKLYVNLLLLKSKKTKELTSLIFLIKQNIIYVKEINCSYVEKIFFDEFINDKRIFYNINFNSYNLIDIKYKYLIFPIKILIHNIYRILKRNIEYKSKIIKTYVEDTLKFYPDQMNQSTILIYPFNLNIRRQKNFIDYCKLHHKDSYSLMGLPYNVIEYLISLKNHNTDKSIVNSEKKSYMLHAKELIDKRIMELYTLDEYEASSFVMHNKLINNKIFVLNKTHGIGTYCLFLKYSRLEVYTEKQYSRYIEWNSDLYVTFQKINIKSKYYKNKNVSLVFILGNMKTYNLKYEEQLEFKMLHKIRDIATNLNMDFFIKFHPNTSYKIRENYKYLKIKEIKDITELNNPLYFTVMSAAFFDFLKSGPFIFTKDNIFNPEDIFGKNILCCDYENCQEIIEKYKVIAQYKELHNLQIDYINNR